MISFLVSSASFAQKVTFLNSDTKKPISGILVFSEHYSEGTLSDKNGQVDLGFFAKDEVVSIEHTSYGFHTIPKAELTKTGIYYLTVKSYDLPTTYIDHPLRYSFSKVDENQQFICIVGPEVVKLENPANSADMLQNTGSVLVQKTQAGGGSPIIRGFEANKILLVVDGIRMNNAIYRSGHLQNSITIDNSVLDQTEIIFGPSSSLYGSDALGGVIHFHTKDPKIIGKDSLYLDGSSYFRYNSNNNGLATHFDFSTGRKKWGLLSSFTLSRFGDSKMGTNRAHGYSDWGLHPQYITQINGQDSMVTNSDPNVQFGSEYAQFDLLEKFIYRPQDNFELALNFQYSTSTPVNRYDKLTEYRNGNLRWAEWYYGPQNRLLSALKMSFKTKSKIMDEGIVQLSYQKIDEDRISRQYQSTFREHQNEDVNVLGFNADFSKAYPKSQMIFYGVEAQHNIVKSTAELRDLYSDETLNTQTRYPDFSHYLNSGFYIEYKKKFKNRAVFSTGGRYSLIYAQSEFKDTSIISLPFNEVQFTTSAPSGHIGFVLNPDSATTIKSMITTGFRAPNIDDYGKVFEKSGNTVVPNDDLKPEYVLGFEFSLNRSFFKELITIGGSVYGNYLFNAMVQRDFTLNGQDSIEYNGEMTKIQAIVNTDNAMIIGANTFLKVQFTKQLDFSYTYNYTYGRDLANNTPLSHIPPQFGKIAFTYAGKKLNTSLYSFYNFRKDLVEYGGGADNLDLTPNEEGTPPWWTLNYRISYELFDILTLQFAAENILDVHYRQFASGISAPGRNFLIGARMSF